MAASIAENVASSETIDEARVWDAVRRAGLADKVNRLENGIETPLLKVIEDNGLELSGGENQKLALARALYKNGPIVILDEPTAALDPIAEHDIYCRFDELVENKTAIYISHRLSSCKFCDRILVFDQGEIIQVGSHDELIRHKGSQYEIMFSAQAAYYSA